MDDALSPTLTTLYNIIMTWLGRKRLCRQCRQWHQVAWRLQSSFAWSNTARVDTVSEIIIAAHRTATPPPPPTTLVNLLRAHQRAIFRHSRAEVPWVSCCWFFSCYCYFHRHFFHTTCMLLVAALTFTATSAAPSSHTVVQYGMVHTCSCCCCCYLCCHSLFHLTQCWWWQHNIATSTTI